MHLTPGDPAAAMLGVRARDQQIEQVREQLGLNEPLPVQLVTWIGRALTGDLGHSYFLGRSVTQAITERLPVTFLLALVGLIIALVMGIPIGIIGAIHRGKPADRIAITMSVAGISMPSFWLSSILILVFSVRLGWLPSGQYVALDQGFVPWLRHLTLPGLAMGVTSAALIARMTRSAMLEVLREDYIRTARSKGLHERVVIYKHALKNAFIPIITVAGILTGELLGGAVIMENVFTLPGIGRLVVSAVGQRDYPVIQGVVLFLALVYLLANFAIDIAYVFIDPRMRHQQRASTGGGTNQ